LQERKLLEIYNILLVSFGHRKWWPGETPFEVMVGAVLTQNTSWSNVEKAISEMKIRGFLTSKKLACADMREVEDAIKSSGYYRQKAERIVLLAKHVERYGSLNEMFAKPLAELREEVLSLKGVGPETADSILLYAAEKPVFVVDAYTRRVFSRIGILPNAEEMNYEEVRSFFEENLPADVRIFNDFHAQIVELAKRFCKKKPVCAGCPLEGRCALNIKVHKPKNCV